MKGIKNMKLKKFCAAGLAALMIFSMAACSKDDKNNNNDNNKNTEGSTDKTQQSDVKLEDICDAIKNAYGEDYVPNMEYDDIFITDTLGLSKNDYEEIVAEGPLVSFNIDTLIAVKAKEGKGDDVEEKLNSYRDYLINDALMYPTNSVKIQASQVVRHGDYVFFVCLGVIGMDTEEQGDEAILAEAKDNTKIAVDAIDSFFK